MSETFKKQAGNYLFIPLRILPSKHVIVEESNYLIYTIRKIFNSLYFLTFLNGLLLMSVVYMEIESDYDTTIFNAIVQSIKKDNSARVNADTFLLKSLKMANYLQQNRQSVFEKTDINDIKASLFNNSLDDLLTGRGACGSASAILVRILEADGFDVRLAQMKVKGNYGGHIIVEARKNSGWIVLDPLYNCYFKKPDGQFASFKERVGEASK